MRIGQVITLLVVILLGLNDSAQAQVILPSNGNPGIRISPSELPPDIDILSGACSVLGTHVTSISSSGETSKCEGFLCLSSDGFLYEIWMCGDQFGAIYRFKSKAEYESYMEYLIAPLIFEETQF